MYMCMYMYVNFTSKLYRYYLFIKSNQKRKKKRLCINDYIKSLVHRRSSIKSSFIGEGFGGPEESSRKQV